MMRVMGGDAGKGKLSSPNTSPTPLIHRMRHNIPSKVAAHSYAALRELELALISGYKSCEVKRADELGKPQ